MTPNAIPYWWFLLKRSHDILYSLLVYAVVEITVSTVMLLSKSYISENESSLYRFGAVVE